MNEMKFWENAYLCAARTFKFNPAKWSPNWGQQEKHCTSFANASVTAWKKKRAKFNEEEEHRQACKKRLAVLRDLGPKDEEQEEELAELECMAENGELQ